MNNFVLRAHKNLAFRIPAHVSFLYQIEAVHFSECPTRPLVLSLLPSLHKIFSLYVAFQSQQKFYIKYFLKQNLQNMQQLFKQQQQSKTKKSKTRKGKKISKSFKSILILMHWQLANEFVDQHATFGWFKLNENLI